MNTFYAMMAIKERKKDKEICPEVMVKNTTG